MKYIIVVGALACFSSVSALVFKSPIHSVKRSLRSSDHENVGGQERNQRRWPNSPGHQQVLKGGEGSRNDGKQNCRVGADTNHFVFTGGVTNPVWDFNEEAQITSVSFGTPPQTLRLLLSISDHNLFIPSSTCSSICRNRLSYNSTLSSTYHENGTQITEDYIRGSFEGFISQDTVHLANLSIPNQQFGEATYFYPSPGPIYNDSRYDDLWDGYLGLSPSQTGIRPHHVPNILETISKHNLLSKNMFSLKLSRGENDPGELMLGGSNPDLYDGELQILKLVEDRQDIHRINGRWKVNATSISIGSGFASLDGYAATLESDFPGIGIREDYMLLLHKYLGMEDLGPYTWPSIDCQRREELEDLTIGLEGRDFTISPWEYLLEMELEGWEGRRCVSTFWPLPGEEDRGWGEKYIILGSAFMRAFYGVFDLDEGTVSLARAKSMSVS